MDDADPEEPSAANPALPDDLIVEEILVRLPPKVVLRFRAACRAWRSDTSTPMFLRSNHDHQVPLPLVFFSNHTKDPDTLDTIDVLAAEYRRTLLAFGCGNTLHASCEGLLLISHENGRYTIYNPATQQRLSLAELTSARYALLYSSRSSDGGVEYRVLFRKGRPAMYHVLTVGSSAPPRRIHLPQGPKDFTELIAAGYPSFQSPSIQFNDALHWLMDKSLVVFDKVVESFRSMRCPSPLRDARLFEIDGTFGMSVRGAKDTAVSVWVLQDYQAEVWTLRYSIDLAMVDRLRVEYDSRHTLLSNDGHLLVSSGAGSTALIQCDAQGTLINDFSVNSWNPKVTGLCYKESIVRHSFFETRGKRRRPQPSLFKRLRKEAGPRSA
ncbi:hypothetical protein QYE76_012704 [Lolium multiflorum]|uniref:F-box associated domain-containing protein n=1 Tax=Lolium multiflorum TaxID=4521 RepID=A0AAD8TZR8_LOLMU|nr:hypothetical protein QYE76_012704 [Lolium multiflorum]